MCKKDGHSLTREFLALRPHNSQDWLSLSLRYTYPTSCMAGYENPTPLPTWHLWVFCFGLIDRPVDSMCK